MTDFDSLYGDETHPGSRDGPPVLIHVGLHKTATTWMQQRIFSALDGSQIAYCGDTARIHGAFVMPPAGRFSVAAALDILAPVLERARALDRPVVLSDEALGGLPFRQKYFREAAAQRIRKTFPDARILVTVREQSAVIYSMYGEYIKYGNSSSLRQFLAQPPAGSVFHPILDLSFYDYERAHRLYAGLFGARNVLMLPMEWTTANPAAALGRLSALIGRELTAPAAADTAAPRNEAWSIPAREVARLLNRTVPQDSRWLGPTAGLASRLTPMAIASRINRWTRHHGGRSRIAREKALVAAALGDSYAGSNARLAARLELDLKALGYRCGPPA